MSELLATINANPYLSLALTLWILVWEGIALWKSARHNQNGGLLPCWLLILSVF